MILPEILITTLDDLDIDAMRVRLRRVRSEIEATTGFEIDQKSSGQSSTKLSDSKGDPIIEFLTFSKRVLMQRHPTANSRSMWVGECHPSDTPPIPNTKEECLAIVDRWLAMLDGPRHYRGPLTTTPAPGSTQRLLAASYLHALHPDEPGGYVDVPLRNPYKTPKPEICYEGQITRWLDSKMAQDLIDQTPVCAHLEMNSNSYEFGMPKTENTHCPNDLGPVDRMRLIADMEGISLPVRKTKPKA